MSNWKVPAEVTILGVTYQTKDYTNSQGNRRPIPISIPMSMLSGWEPNRITNKQKVKNMTQSINEWGVIRPYPCFLPKTSDGKADLYDAHHLFEADQTLPNELVTCSMIWWVDPDSDVDKKAYVMKINQDQTGWDIGTHLRTAHKVHGGDYTYLYKKAKKHGAATIASAYTGIRDIPRKHKLKTQGFKFTGDAKAIGDYIVGHLDKLKLQSNKVSTFTYRQLNVRFFETAKQIGFGSEWTSFVDTIFNSISAKLVTDKIEWNKEKTNEFYDMHSKFYFNTKER